MKNKILLCAFSLLFAFAPNLISASNPDSTGLPGDNLNLRAVLDLFKRSTTLEDFEKKLNTKENKINNLDLNGDGNVDYIRVVDLMKEKVHAIVLQVPITTNESQDVAVIELEMKGENLAQVQIVGDEELYGEKYIVQPREVKTKDSLEGKWKGDFNAQVIFVNVWYWPCVQYVYYPGYIVWVSPWYWMYWPYWWSPWPPYPYYMYYGYVYYYQDYYYCVNEYEIEGAHSYYGPRRVSSPIVHHRYEVAHEQYKEQKKNVDQPTKPAKPNVDIQPVPNTPQPPKGNVQPPPNSPRPDVQPSPNPTPVPRGDVQPAPSPRPNVQPAPQPSPRPKGRPRSTRRKSRQAN